MSSTLPLCASLLLSLVCGITATGDSDSRCGSSLLTPFIEKNESHRAKTASLVPPIEGVYSNDSHAGHITVNKTLGIHLFFWHFPSIQNPDTSPLVVSLSGGPGLSSMEECLWEHGPFDWNLNRRTNTWVEQHSVVYIDTLADVGFSYSDSGEDGHRTNTNDVAADLYSFLEQFYQVFTEFQDRELYIAGTSYAGKYISALGHLIHNERQAKRSSLPMAGVILGAPFLNGRINHEFALERLYLLGALSAGQKERQLQVLTGYLEQLENGDFNATPVELFYSINPKTVTSQFEIFDNFVLQEDAERDAMNTAMNRQDIKCALHIPSMLAFADLNLNLTNKFGADALLGHEDHLKVLMENYKVLVYTGDYDLTVPDIGVEAIMQNISWSRQSNYRRATRHVWWRRDGSGREPEFRGYFSSVGRLCRVVVHGAGHFSAHDQPEAVLQLVSDFISEGCLQV